MNNINMDLIIGLSGEGVKEFRYSFLEMEKLMLEFFMVYMFFFKWVLEMMRNKYKYKVVGREEVF